MKKVTAFVGSAHRKNTYNAVVQFLNKLEALGDVESEIVLLSEYKLGVCRGCRLCFEMGEEFCPLRDDRDVLMDKIMASDGVVFATPNYSFQVSGLMKIFLDKIGFIFHRPRYFGKTFTSLVTQGFSRGSEIVKYLDFCATFLGFNTVKGTCLTILDPRTEKDLQKTDRALESLSKRFYSSLAKPAYPVPTLLKLMIFRMGRTSIKQLLDDRSCDYRYYAEKGWFASDYFYPTHLGMLKNAAGHLLDFNVSCCAQPDFIERYAMPEYYEIKIKGHLDRYWSDWFAGLTLIHMDGNETLLAGQLPDQAALHGLLERIRDLNLTLISVTCGSPSTDLSAHEK